jgi:hypothetical protein
MGLDGGTDTKPMGKTEPSSCLTQCQTEKKSFLQLCNTECLVFCIHIFIQKDKADIANNPYLMVRSRSEYYTSMSVSGLPTFLILVENMNLLSSCQTET